MLFEDFSKELLKNGVFRYRFETQPTGLWLGRVAFPHGIMHLDNYADNKDIVLPSRTVNEWGKIVNIVKISKNVFFKNEDIERLVVSRFVNKFMPSQFEDCLNLSAITIPATIRKIPANCFKGCINLKDIYYEGGNDSFESIKFDDYTYSTVGEDKAYRGEEITYRRGNIGAEIIRECISDNECFRRARVHFNCTLDVFDWCLGNPA